MSNFMQKRQNAFTLIELLVTLSVVAILIALAVPSFNSQMLNNRSIALGEDFANAINLARVEAVKRSGRASLCASSDGQTCVGAWTDGFIVFVDFATSDTAAAPVMGPAPVILKAWPKQDTQAVIDVTSGGPAVNFFRFNSLGALARVTGSTVIVKAHLQNCTSNSARQITVNLSGMVKVERTTLCQ
jgi:type IV fimbrial biogenesis protein FimT